MPIMVVVEGKAKKEAVDRMKATLKKGFKETRAYDGCMSINAYTLDDDGQTFLFVQHWETKPHYERYLAWRTETGFVAELVNMLESGPSIRFFQQLDA